MIWQERRCSASVAKIVPGQSLAVSQWHLSRRTHSDCDDCLTVVVHFLCSNLTMEINKLNKNAPDYKAKVKPLEDAIDARMAKVGCTTHHGVARVIAH